MWTYNYTIPSDELYHHGVIGQKWGRRRYQNEDGSYTPAGEKRYLKSDGSLTIAGKKLKLKEDIRDATNKKNYEGKGLTVRQANKEAAAKRHELIKVYKSDEEVAAKDDAIKNKIKKGVSALTGGATATIMYAAVTKNLEPFVGTGTAIVAGIFAGLAGGSAVSNGLNAVLRTNEKK